MVHQDDVGRVEPFRGECLHERIGAIGSFSRRAARKAIAAQSTIAKEPEANETSAVVVWA